VKPKPQKEDDYLGSLDFFDASDGAAKVAASAVRCLVEEEPRCQQCDGTGEGCADGVRCSACRGRGF